MNLENLNVVELSIEENLETEEGRSLWYDVAYGIDTFLRGLQSFGEGGVSGSANRFAQLSKKVFLIYIKEAVNTLDSLFKKKKNEYFQ